MKEIYDADNIHPCIYYADLRQQEGVSEVYTYNAE